MEGPRGLPFSYIKALAFSLRLEGKKKMKRMVYTVEEIFQLGRQPLKKSSAQQYIVLK
jgi:hypothetical protein